jgi:hypothetical protein
MGMRTYITEAEAAVIAYIATSGGSMGDVYRWIDERGLNIHGNSARSVYQMALREAEMARPPTAHEEYEDTIDTVVGGLARENATLRNHIRQLEDERRPHPVSEPPPTHDDYLVYCSAYDEFEVKQYSVIDRAWYFGSNNKPDYWWFLPKSIETR